MSELASAAPSYVTRLALKAMPFSDAVDASIFFNAPHVEQSLNLALHLASSSDKVAVISTEAGIGKTCLLTQFVAKSQDNLKVTLIQGKYAPDLKTILFQCLRDFGVDEYDIRTGDDHQAMLHTRVAQLRQLDVRPVLLIDDADQLLPEVLTFLLSCLKLQQENQYLMQGVICISQALSGLDEIRERIQKIDLSALTEQQIEPYLTARLNQVGYEGDALFSKKQLKQFFKQSKGNPALLNKLAHQTLLGVKPTVKARKPLLPANLNVSALLKGGAGTVVAVALIILLLFQEQINRLFEPSIAGDQTLEVIEEEPELATVTVSPDEVVSQDQFGRNELVDLVSELEQTGDMPTIATSITSLKDKSWILGQDLSSYTFQLMGSWEKQEVLDFVQKYELDGDVAIFESLRNGKIWHVLVYGVYANKQAAIEASQAWPEPMNTLPTWLRRFESVQTQINGG
jgi:DamX protein